MEITRLETDEYKALIGQIRKHSFLMRLICAFELRIVSLTTSTDSSFYNSHMICTYLMRKIRSAKTSISKIMH